MTRFYKTQTHLNFFLAQLKLILCPHCRKSGFLIRHNFLKGFSEHDCNSTIVRGQRIFCSNRNNRLGCGQTFCIVAAWVLPRFMISANSLWRFFEQVKTKAHLAGAFRRVKFPLVLSSAYRLFKKFGLGQAHIRTHLNTKKPPPAMQCSSPAIQTILHLKHVFNQTDCPISEFQYQFQTSFF